MLIFPLTNSEKQKAWRDRDPERARAARKRWRETHVEYRREAHKRWREENKEHVKEYSRKHSKQYYHGTLKTTRLRYIAQRGSKCEICGYEKCIGALHFHHILNNKTVYPATLTKKAKLSPAEQEELDSCVLVCANCHAELHEKERQSASRAACNDL